MIRLFVSVELPKEVRAEIHKASLDFKKVAEGNFVGPDNIHITLKFLKWVDESKVAKIKEKLSRIKFSSFDCELKGVGAFPTKSSPRVLWVGSTNKEFSKLANDIDKTLSKLGFEKESREFHTHATFCRVKTHRKPAMYRLFEKYENKSFGKFKVDKFHLMESKLRRTGPLYSPLGLFKAP